jgi:Fe-S-cluster-containing hydrogenase component 2
MRSGCNNGQGGREHGQKADQLPGQRSISSPEHRKHVCQVWDLPEDELPQAGVSVVEMFDKMREGEIRGLLSICNNVMVSLPDTNDVRHSLEGLDFYVCIDFFMSEGARYADVVLPGSAWSEDEGVTCNSEGRVVKINKANNPPGEARADWWIVQEIARRMDRGKYFAFNSPREIFEELRVASRGGNADYYGITWEKIEKNNRILVCPADAIKVSDDGVVMSALKPRCLDCRNCVNACPFGVPKYNTEIHLQMKCDMCYDRSSAGLKPMCASVCPTGAISFGKYEQIVPLRRTKPVNVHVFGNQKVERKCI